ncbi:unnamed protein product [Fraxinus pennsylvanica]|uniref:HMA domain-containing protein n=1 Tax=Fraxinus pennsylvanica TaxID=56036 RepID=A0AAD2A731_9LAMI|nr:unnamed protein product [Fraxinus pennsylvanica]
MAEKVTVMVLKVDLQCPSCYKKIKTILCKIPQIRGQIFDVKQNTVTINVVCCSPKKIRDELCCKGGKVIKSIEIIDTDIKSIEIKKPDTEGSDKQQKDQLPPTPVTGLDIRITLDQPARTCCEPCSHGYGGGPCYHGYPPLPLCSNSYYGYGYGRECKCGCGCCCGCGRGCHLRKCVCHIEENPTAECKIM